MKEHTSQSDEDFYTIPLHDSRYAINAKGTVISNSTEPPHVIQSCFNAKREATVILYTPSLRSYLVAELLLLTFKREGKTNEKKFIHYQDSDRQNLSLDNLDWSDKEALVSLELVRGKVKRNEEKQKYFHNRLFFRDTTEFLLRLSRAVNNLDSKTDMSIRKECTNILDEMQAVITAPELNIQKLIKLTEKPISDEYTKSVVDDFVAIVKQHRSSYLKR